MGVQVPSLFSHLYDDQFDTDFFQLCILFRATTHNSSVLWKNQSHQHSRFSHIQTEDNNNDKIKLNELLRKKFKSS